MFWFIALFIANLVLSYVLRPKPQTQPPAMLRDIQAPTAEVGREIAVLFGTRNIKSSNVVWYGDLRTTPVKSGGGKK